MMRRSLTTTLVIVLLTSITSVTRASDHDSSPDEENEPGPRPALSADPNVIDDARTHLRASEPNDGTHAMVYWDQNQVTFKSAISIGTQAMLSQGESFEECFGPTDPMCSLSQQQFDVLYYNAVLGNCGATPESVCVKQFDLIDTDGNTLATGSPTQRLRPSSPGWASTFDGKTNSGVPGSDEPWIWTLDGVEYLHLGLLESQYRRESGRWVHSPDKNLRYSIYPFKRVNGDIYLDSDGVFKAPSCLGNRLQEAGDDTCYQRTKFRQGLRFRVTLRVPSNITGWLNGRLERLVAYTTVHNSNYTDLTVEASPLPEIVSAQWVPFDSEIKRYLQRVNRIQNRDPNEKNYDIPPVDPDDAQAMRTYQELERKGVIRDSATTVELAWRLQTTTSQSRRFASREQCSKGNRIDGIVSSNAAVYEPGSPEYLSKEGALAYRVGAPHFQPDGKTANIGRYAFAMREDLVKCVYGIDRIPIFAGMEVRSDASGDTQVATVVVGKRNGWVYLASDNFTYSSPTIKVKFKGTKAASPKVKSSVTITCVKGKVSRKVTGVKPSCPKGFKKK